jgi:hypothetical protein
MIAQNDGDSMAVRGARLLSESDPLRAARVLLDGLKIQPSGGRAAVLRFIVEETCKHDPHNAATVLADLQGIAKRAAERGQGKR